MVPPARPEVRYCRKHDNGPPESDVRTRVNGRKKNTSLPVPHCILGHVYVYAALIV